MAGHCSGVPVLAYLAKHKNACVTLDQLDAALEMERHAISGAVRRLVTDKHVLRRDAGCFQVTASGIAADAKGYKSGQQREKRALKRKPRETSLQQRIWKTLRIRKRVTIPEVLANAARGDELSAQANVQNYFRRLAGAGYLTKLKVKVPGTAPNSRGHSVWLLVKDTGPKAPGWYDAKRELVDHNTGERISVAKVAK